MAAGRTRAPIAATVSRRRSRAARRGHEEITCGNGTGAASAPRPPGLRRAAQGGAHGLAAARALDGRAPSRSIRPCRPLTRSVLGAPQRRAMARRGAELSTGGARGTGKAIERAAALRARVRRQRLWPLPCSPPCSIWRWPYAHLRPASHAKLSDLVVVYILPRPCLWPQLSCTLGTWVSI